MLWWKGVYVVSSRWTYQSKEHSNLLLCCAPVNTAEGPGVFFLLSQCLSSPRFTFLLLTFRSLFVLEIRWKDCVCCLKLIEKLDLDSLLLSPIFITRLFLVASCPHSVHLFLLPCFFFLCPSPMLVSVWVLIYQSRCLLQRVVVVWSPASEKVDFKPIKQQKVNEGFSLSIDYSGLFFFIYWWLKK